MKHVILILSLLITIGCKNGLQPDPEPQPEPGYARTQTYTAWQIFKHFAVGQWSWSTDIANQYWLDLGPDGTYVLRHQQIPFDDSPIVHDTTTGYYSIELIEDGYECFVSLILDNMSYDCIYDPNTGVLSMYVPGSGYVELRNR